MGKLRVSAIRALLVTAASACALALWAGTPAADSPRSNQAYLRGQLVDFHLVPAERGQQAVSIGPWQFGARVADRKPRDHRLNLYLVSPGTQHHAPEWEEFDHNDIINASPAEGAVVEWDVYWAIVLDPTLSEDLRSEQELIVRAQEEFAPGDLFEFRDIPGQAFLRTFLKLDSLEGLAPYRMKDGQLPRVIIVPAGFAVRAGAAPEEPAATEPAAAARK